MATRGGHDGVVVTLIGNAEAWKRGKRGGQKVWRG